LTAQFFKLRCNFGQIAEILDWGVNHLGLEQDEDNLCSSSIENCGTIGTKSHPMSKLISACQGKRECLIEDFQSLMPIDPNAACPLFKTTSLFVSYQCS
jgi:hypothetical protein